MGERQLPPRPAPLSLIPPCLFTIATVLPLLLNIGLTAFCMRLALYDARHGYNLSLFIQCVCLMVNGWMLFRGFRWLIHGWLLWINLRRGYHGLWDELDALAEMHLQMRDGGIECSEHFDHKYQEFTDRFDARIREAFEAQKLPPLDISKFKIKK